MTKRKSKPEIMWVITGEAGFYYRSNSRTRRDAITRHTERIGWSWEKCRARGDRAVKVEIREVK